MKDKINIAELLKNCPKGMELDCTMFENVTFVRVDMSKKQFPIQIAVGGTHSKYLTKEGCFHDTTLLPESKCVIFPKGKTTWEGFVPPCRFKDGDIVFYDNCVSIFKEWGDETLFRNYVKVDIDGRHPMLCDRTHSNGKGIKREERFATEEEKAKLFKAIKDNGYRWNEETKTLEVLPKFKVGDRIQSKKFIEERTIKICEEEGYWTTVDTWIRISDQDDWELVPNKFDITTLKPFDKVLIRTKNFTPVWTIDFYDGYQPNIGGSFTPFGVTSGKYFQQCIPYEGNEHLRGTTNDCDEYFKTWR